MKAFFTFTDFELLQIEAVVFISEFSTARLGRDPITSSSGRRISYFCLAYKFPTAFRKH